LKNSATRVYSIPSKCLFTDIYGSLKAGLHKHTETRTACISEKQRFRLTTEIESNAQCKQTAERATCWRTRRKTAALLPVAWPHWYIDNNNNNNTGRPNQLAWLYTRPPTTNQHAIPNSCQRRRFSHDLQPSYSSAAARVKCSFDKHSHRLTQPHFNCSLVRKTRGCTALQGQKYCNMNRSNTKYNI